MNKFFEEKKLNTGDLILFNEKKSIISRLIEYFTNSKFSHIGIVIKNPDFTPEKLEGYYLLESGYSEYSKDAEDNVYKLGAQLKRLDVAMKDYNGDIYYRKLHCERNEEFYEKIKKAHSVLHNKPYNLNAWDWIKSLFDLKIGNEQKLNCFFCSALCAYVYTQLGFLNKDTDWTIIRPRDFSTEHKNNRIKFINCQIDKEIKFNLKEIENE